MVDWRAHPQSADGYLFIMQPTVIFAARVNMADAAYPLAEITYDGVTTGAWTDLEQGMTLLVGTAPGLWNLGRIYLRGDLNHVVATSTTIQIGYCSRGHQFGEVDLVDNAYITVLDLFEPWRRASRMLDDGTIYKDYALGFGVNTHPVAHVGSRGGLGTIGFVDGTGYLAVDDFNAAGSYVTTAYAAALFQTIWDMKDGTYTSGSSTSSAPDAKFPPGYRWIKLNVTDTLGARAQPRRFCVMALEASGVNAPKRVRRARWKLTPEGAIFNCELWERLDPSAYVPGTVVMFLTAQDYGGETVWIVSFAGYLDYDRSFARAQPTDTERGTAIYALDVAGRMAQQRIPPSFLARETEAQNVNQLIGANLDRYLWWTLFWHTHVPMLTDFQWSGRTDIDFSAFSAPGGDIYTVSDNLARAFAYRLTHDSRGRLRVLIDPWRQEEAERDPTDAQDILETDWTALERVKKPFPRQGALRSAATLTSTADASTLTTPVSDIYAVAPGTVEGIGISEGQSSYRWLVPNALAQQERLGQDYERGNAHEEFLRLMLAHGLDGGIEPADLVPVTLTASVENVGWLDDVLVAERCLPATVEYTFSDEDGAITQALTLERETFGAPGAWDPIALDSTPPYGGGSLVSGLWAGVPTIAAFNDDGYVYLFANWQTTPVVTRYSLVSLGMAGTLVMFIVDAFSPAYLGTGSAVNGELLTSSHRYTINDIFGTPSLTNSHALRYAGEFSRSMQGTRVEEGVYAAESHIYASTAPDATDIDVRAAGVDTNYPDLFGSWVGGDGNGFPGGVFVSEHVPGRIITSGFIGTSVDSQLKISNDYGATWANVGAGTFWTLAGDIHIPVPVTDDSVIYHGGNDPIGAFHIRMLYKTTSGVQADVSPQNEFTHPYGPANQFAIKSCDIDARRLLLVGYGGAGGVADTMGVWRSDDAAATWVPIIPYGTLATMFYRAGNIAGDDPDTFFLWGQNVIAFSSDAGATIVSKMGNIAASFGTVGTFKNICGNPT